MGKEIISLVTENAYEINIKSIASFCNGLFSTNMIKTFADGNIVQTLVVAILLGVAILKMKNAEHKA